MRILFYGRLAELVKGELEVDVPPGRTVNELRNLLAEAHPELAGDVCNARIRACVGDSIVPETYVIAPGEAVEFFPPVSGG
jgi:molybdopterin converting factor small subunit